MLKSVLIVLFLFTTSHLVTQDNKGITFLNAVPSDFSKANKENKLIFLYFHAPDCGACDRVAKKFKNKSVGQLYDKYYKSYSVNGWGEGKVLADKYGVYNYPTLIYLSPKGKIKFSARGYRSAESVFEIGKMASLSPRAINKYMTNKYKSDPDDTDHLFDHIEYHFIMDRTAKFEKLLKEYLNRREGIEKSIWMDLVLAYGNNYESYANEILIQEKEEFIRIYGEKYINDLILTSVLGKVNDTHSSDNVKLFEIQFIREARNLGFDPEEKRLILFYSDFLLRGEDIPNSTMKTYDRAIYTKYALAALNIEDHQFEIEHLTSIGVYLLTYHQKEEALKKLLEVLETNFLKEEDHENLDLQSLVLYALGDEDAAVKKIVQARDLAYNKGISNYTPNINIFRSLGIIK